MEMKDYYEILEVHPKASQEVIKKAYQTLAKQYHPDVTVYEKGFAHEKLTELNEAYSVLSNPERRREYDSQFLGDSSIETNTSETDTSSTSSEETIVETHNSEDKKVPENMPWYIKVRNIIGKGIYILLLLLVGAFARVAVKNMFTSHTPSNPTSHTASQTVQRHQVDRNESSKNQSTNQENIKRFMDEGDSFYKNGDYVKAVEAFTKVIQIDAKYSVVYYKRGFAYLELEEYSRAIDDFTKSIQLNKNSSVPYEGRAYAYRNLKNYSSAIDDFSKAIKLHSDKSLYLKRGGCYYQLKQYEQAVSDYTKAIEMDPEYGAAYFWRSFAYMGLGDFEKANADSEKATLFKDKK